MEDVKFTKDKRTESARKVRNLASKATRLIKGEIIYEGTMSEMLLTLDEYWDSFQDDHGAFKQAVGFLEAHTKGAGQRESYVNGKDMVQYYEEISQAYTGAASDLKEKISEDRKNQEEARANLTVRMKKHVAERDVRNMKRSTLSEWKRIGDDLLDRLDTLPKMSPQELQEIRIRLETTSRFAEKLEENIEKLVELDLSSVQDLIEEAQDTVDITRDKTDALRSRMMTLRVPAHPPQPEHPDRRLQWEDNEEAMGGMYNESSTTMSPGQGLRPEEPSATSQAERRGSLLTQKSAESTLSPSRARVLVPGLRKVAENRSSDPYEIEDQGVALSTFRETKPMKFRPQELPTFSGARKDWARFKSIWLNIVEKQGFNAIHLASILVSSVKRGTALSLIKAVTIKDETSYRIMWDRLEEYYSDTGAVLASLLQDLEELKSVRNAKNKDVIEFINDLELIHESLYSISEKHPERIDSNRVDRLASCLPDTCRDLWNRVYFRLDPETKQAPFSEFVLFCTEERSLRLRFLDVNKDSTSSDRKVSSHSTESSASTKKTTKPKYCWLDDSHSGHYANQCDLWGALTPTERRQSCLENKKCIVCLDSFGKGHKCRPIRTSVLNKYYCQECRIRHRNDIACPSKKKGADVESGSISNGTAYIARYEVKVKGQPETVPIFADNGSDISFVNEQSAKRRGYKQVGSRTLNITTINGIQQVRTKIYNVPIIRIDGQIENIQCHSINKPVTNRSKGVNIKEVGKLFPKYKPLARLDRDERPCEILLGLDYYQLHPRQTVGRNKSLSINRGPLGDTLVGTIDNDSHKEESWSSHSYYITKAQDSTWCKFITGEDLGISINPTCGGCKCGGCPLIGHRFSFKEEQEMDLIKSGLAFEDGRWTCKIPWIKSPDSLPDNKYIAKATLNSTIRTLSRNPTWFETYNQQIMDLEANGFCRKLTKEEELKYEGPRFYICHLAVLAPKSTSTPIRIVFNSSQTCKGISLSNT